MREVSSSYNKSHHFPRISGYCERHVTNIAIASVQLSSLLLDHFQCHVYREGVEIAVVIRLIITRRTIK